MLWNRFFGNATFILKFSSFTVLSTTVLENSDNQLRRCSAPRTVDDESTIYVEQPWSPDSIALVAVEPEESGIPNEVAKINAEYFLEVFLATIELFPRDEDGL
ncbi:hypothetical protein M1E08_17425 [Erwinia sp. PK3-005]